jgi:hypothetical protein
MSAAPAPDLVIVSATLRRDQRDALDRAAAQHSRSRSGELRHLLDGVHALRLDERAEYVPRRDKSAAPPHTRGRDV